MLHILLALTLSSISYASSPVAQNNPPNHEDIQPANSEKRSSEVIDAAKGATKMARVYFVTPKDGDTVSKTFKVKMAVSGYKVRPAGEAPDEMTSGHHHILIDSGPTPAGQVVAADEKHIHFGKGQTETKLTLTPGEHTLTLQFADGAHRSFGDSASQTIKINVR